MHTVDRYTRLFIVCRDWVSHHLVQKLPKEWRRVFTATPVSWSQATGRHLLRTSSKQAPKSDSCDVLILVFSRFFLQSPDCDVPNFSPQARCFRRCRSRRCRSSRTRSYRKGVGVRGRVLGTEGRGVLAWVVPGSCFASQPGNAQFTWALQGGFP